MKQKLILLLVLIASLAACTKDDDDNDDIYKNSADIASLKENDGEKLGEFEGEWIVGLIDKEVVDTAILTVTNSSFQIRLPEKYLVNEEFYMYFSTPHPYTVNNGVPVTYPRSSHYRYEYKQSEKRYIYPYKVQGYSNNKYYYDFNISPVELNNVQLFDTEEYEKKLGQHTSLHGQTFYMGYQSSVQGVGIFDTTSLLWTLKVTFDQHYIIFPTIDPEKNNNNPIELVFIAKKKL